MTAEIAIINKGAVTLATDSAVTLTVRGAQKIYNCADKLFELSDHDPIGIMVFNNLNFMGIPLEVAVKQFRSRNTDVRYDTVAEAATAFFRYLEEDLQPSASHQKRHARAIVASCLHSVHRLSRDAGDADALMRIAQGATARLKALRAAENLSRVTEQQLLEFYGDLFGETIASIFDGLPLGEEPLQELIRIGALALTREHCSELMTGIVFAGFGRLETFPALVAFETDGVIYNRLKKRETYRVQTTRDQIAGEIIPFAQREMVDRFLFGIDPEFETAFEEYLDQVVQSTAKVLENALPGAERTTTKQRLERARQTATDQWNNILQAMKEKFMREVQDMVYLMPKTQLAELATELVNLTSVKRKFSSGEDSVGGPIDVAVISRTDGFVWVRRKHYFSSELNPRYFHRKYGGRRHEQ